MLTDYQRYRLYEILPGLTIWLTLILGILFSFIKPLWMIYFIILFDIYWVLKVINFAFYLVTAWFRFRRVKRVDWKDALHHEITDNDTKRHIVFLTVYNESWDVVRSAMQSVCDACYDHTKFTIVVAGEEKNK